MSMRARFLPKYPVRVAATNGFTATMSNGILTFTPAFDQLPLVASIDTPEDKLIWVYDPSTEDYSAVALQALVNAISGIGAPHIVTTDTYTATASDVVIVVQRTSPGTPTNITLPASGTRNKIPVTIIDASTGVTDHEIIVTPDGSETVQGQDTWTIRSTPQTLGGLTFYPIEEIDGWYLTPLDPKDIIVYDTVADMTAAGPWKDGQVIMLRGYTQPGDGGQGTLAWNAASTLDADDGIVFEADAGGTGRIIRHFVGSLSNTATVPRIGTVESAWFGDVPVPPGATEQLRWEYRRDAIQRALDRYSYIRLRAGEIYQAYRVGVPMAAPGTPSTTIWSWLYIRWTAGASPSTTKRFNVTLDLNGSTPTRPSGSKTSIAGHTSQLIACYGDDGTPVNEIRVINGRLNGNLDDPNNSNIPFAGSDQVQDGNLNFNYATNITVRDIVSFNAIGNSISASGCEGGIFENLTLNQNGKNGLYISAPGTLTGEKRIFVRNIRGFDNNYNPPGSVPNWPLNSNTTYGTLAVAAATDVNIDGVHSESDGCGIQISGVGPFTTGFNHHRINLSNATVLSPNGIGITVVYTYQGAATANDYSRVNITNCTVVGAVTNYNVQVEGAREVNFTNCIFSNCAVAYQVFVTFGVLVAPGSGTEVATDITFTGCTFQNGINGLGFCGTDRTTVIGCTFKTLTGYGIVYQDFDPPGGTPSLGVNSNIDPYVGPCHFEAVSLGNVTGFDSVAQPVYTYTTGYRDANLLTATLSATGVNVAGGAGSANTALTLDAQGTGTLTLQGTATGQIITTRTVRPAANDGAALGVSGTAYSDAFLASGAVVDFGAGNVTITHSAGNILATGIWTLNSATASTSTSTGALVLSGASGGLGVAGRINAGGQIQGNSFIVTGSLALVANSLAADFSTTARIIATGTDASTAGTFTVTLSATDATPFLEAFRAAPTGGPPATNTIVTFPTILTTASAANAFLDSGASNSLLRSTSSERYKHGIEPLDPAFNKIMDLRPVWYRSKSGADNPEHSFYGFTAEQVAAVDPRLVHWSYRDEDWELVEDGSVKGDDGVNVVTYRRQPKAGAVKVPDGVQYERLTVWLVGKMQGQETLIADLSARLAKLEGAGKPR